MSHIAKTEEPEALDRRCCVLLVTLPSLTNMVVWYPESQLGKSVTSAVNAVHLKRLKQVQY